MLLNRTSQSSSEKDCTISFRLASSQPASQSAGRASILTIIIMCYAARMYVQSKFIVISRARGIYAIYILHRSPRALCARGLSAMDPVMYRDPTRT